MELLSRTAFGFLSLSAVFAGSASAIESFRKPTVSSQAGNGSTLLASRGSPVHILADAADWPGVLRAAHDLALDFGRVTGTNGTLTTSGTGTANASAIFNVTGISEDWSVGSSDAAGATAGTIIVGTIGNSNFIDSLIASGQLDVSAIKGQWEAYVSAVVPNAGNATGEALVIAGKLVTKQEESHTKTTQEAIAEVPSMASTTSQSKLVSRHGTGLLISPPCPMSPSMRSRPPKSRNHQPSSTVAFSSTMKLLR